MNLKTVIALIVMAITSSFFFSCNEDEDQTPQNGVGLLALLDHIAEDEYYSTDDLTAEVDLNGIWEVDRTSGGFHGGGYEKDFDHLLVKPNGIFGLEKAGELMASGKIQRQSRTDDLISVAFEHDFLLDSAFINLMFDNVKFVTVSNDSLDLISDCCDRFDTHLIKTE